MILETEFEMLPNIEVEVRRRYTAIRTSPVNASQIVLLHIGQQQTALAAGQDAQPETVFLLEIGSQATAHQYFKHMPPTPLELEHAILTVEDEVARVRTLIPDGAVLYTTDVAVRELAVLAGVKEEAVMVMSLEAMERTFDRMASVSLGRPASHEGIPKSAEFFARLLILREFMHHLQFSSIICV